MIFQKPHNNMEIKRLSPEKSEEHTSELQSHSDLVCRLLLEKKKKKNVTHNRSLNQNGTRQRENRNEIELSTLSNLGPVEGKGVKNRLCCREVGTRGSMNRRH